MTKTERWLNLLAFLDRRCPVTREEILSQVDDYKAGWLTGDDKTPSRCAASSSATRRSSRRSAS